MVKPGPGKGEPAAGFLDPERADGPVAAAGTDFFSDDVAHRGRTTLGEAVAAELELRILRAEFTGSQKLPTEAELAQRLGVSRSVVRDAIRMLAARGLVSVKQGQGMTVSPPSDEAFGNALIALLMRSDLTMGDVVTARAALDIQLAGLAIENGTDEDWDRMESHLERFSEAVEQGDSVRAHREHLDFHFGLYAAFRLPALALLLRPVSEYIHVTSFPPADDDPAFWDVEVHPPILAALRNRELAGVQQALREHFAFVEDEAYAEFRATPFRSGAILEAVQPVRARTEMRQSARTT